MAGEAQAQRTVSVVGFAEVQRQSDTAEVTVEVEAKRPSAAEARQHAAEVTASVRQALAALDGLEERQVTTSQLRLSPHYRWLQETSEQQLTGYSCSQTLAIRLEPLSNELLGQVVDAAVAAGGNDIRINSVSTGLSRATLRTAQSEARAAAVRDALAVAREMAEAAGQVLGPVLSLADSMAGDHPVPTPRVFAAAAHAAAGAPTPVVVSETSVTARVSAVVALA